MAQFLKKVIFFLCTICILFGFLLVSTTFFISKGNHFEVPKNISSVILGHSQSACSLNDSLLINFYNLSNNAEGYPYSYFKAKKLLESNPQIENVFIEYTNNQLEISAMERVYGNALEVNVPNSLPVLEWGFLANAFWENRNPFQIAKTLSQSLASNVEFIREEDSNFVESNWHPYEVPTRVYDRDEEKSISFYQKLKASAKEYSVLSPLLNSEENQELAIENIEYLKKLAQLCKNKGVHLYFIRSPLPSGTSFENEIQFLKILENNFEDVIFLDFKEFPLADNKYADNQHLNVFGQREFTQFFGELLEYELLQKIEPQGFINSKMEQYRGSSQFLKK